MHNAKNYKDKSDMTIISWFRHNRRDAVITRNGDWC